MTLTRRTALCLALAAGAMAPVWQAAAQDAVAVETRTLDALHEAALAEGGRLIVYAGGDTPGQQDGMKKAFEERFPGMTLDIVVDYSKFHNARIDNQLATGTLVPDVAQLQTLQDFPRWKDEGVLLPYKPAGWDMIWPEFRDPDGAFTGIFVDAFSNVVNSALVAEADWPREARDYLRPEFRGKLVATYPVDDDAVLFWFRLVVDKYGWSWLEEFAAQEPIWVRGTQAPADLVEAGQLSPPSPRTGRWFRGRARSRASCCRRRIRSCRGRSRPRSSAARSIPKRRSCI